MSEARYIDPVSGTLYPLDQPRWCSDERRPLLVTPGRGLSRDEIERGTRSLWRFRAALPLAIPDPISLGEGCTPAVERPWGDLRPVFKGHVLLVPRVHVETLPDLPAELRDPLLDAAQRIATAVQVALGAQGSFVAMNNTVSQSVPHLHLHVVPRTKGDGLRGFFWPRTKYAGAEELASYAERLGSAIASG